MLSRLLAALLALALTSSAVMAEDNVGVSTGRTLGASEQMTAPGIIGTDYSANRQSFASGYTLLSTIPAVDKGKTRRGYFIQAQCAAGLVVLFDDGTTDASSPSIACTTGGKCTALILAGGSADGEQGGSVDYGGYPHSGRLRIASIDPSCQLAAHAW